ncbi:hypothetical protein D9M68_648710 [compost metagenome]
MGRHQFRIGFDDAAAVHAGEKQGALLQEVGLVVDGVAGALDVHRDTAGQALDIAGEHALGLAESDAHTHHLAAGIGQLDERVGDLERVHRAIGVDRAQGEVVDQDVGRARRLAGPGQEVVVLAELELLDIELGIDVHAEIDPGVVDPGIGVGGQVDEGLASDFGEFVVGHFLHARLGRGCGQDARKDNGHQLPGWMQSRTHGDFPGCSCMDTRCRLVPFPATIGSRAGKRPDP